MSIDFELLRQELSDVLVEGNKERYRFEWPGKRQAILNGNTPITATLRPCREESIDFETTENLYIEGDNLDVLKLLQETYLGKIKMIYIDPPYNTGNDSFVYDDDYSASYREFAKTNGQRDEDGNLQFDLRQNNENNGRFHSDWLNMLYPRLKLAKDLISDDGVIFISIDDGEADKLKQLCDEIFGSINYRNKLLVRRRIKSLNLQFADKGLNSFNIGYEYILVYSKSQHFLFKPIRMEKQNAPEKGTWNVFWSNADRPTMRYDILGFTPQTGQWRWQKELAELAVKNYIEYTTKYESKMSLEDYWHLTGKTKRFVRRINGGTGKNGGVQYWIGPSNTSLRTSNWTDIEVSQIAKDYDLPFNNPKNVDLIKTLITSIFDNNFYILDFFSGSATTADACIRLNAEDGGTRKYIMVQLPEVCDEKSEAFKAGYKNICEIGKDRIRRAVKKIQEEHPTAKFDAGFRVLKLDSSNMKDVYYKPAEYQQGQIDMFADNVKVDRTPEDLLFQVMLDVGALPSSKVTTTVIGKKKIFNVADNYLLACFDTDVSEEIVKNIAKLKPIYAVFCDNSFANDDMAANSEQLFKTLSPNTKVRVL